MLTAQHGTIAMLFAAALVAPSPGAVCESAIVGEVDSVFAFNIAVDGRYAYCASSSHGVQIVDLDDVATPVHVSSAPMPMPQYGAGDIVVNGDHAYVARRSFSGLEILDISDPYAPAFVEPGFGFHVDAVEMADGLLYTAASNGEVRVLDVSNSASPQQIGFIDLPMHLGGIDVVGDYAYLSAEHSSTNMIVLDVSDPSAMTIASTTDIGGSGSSIVVSGNRAYLAAHFHDLRVVDVTDPTAPVALGSVELPDRALAVSLHGDRLCVACDDAGLQILDISGSWPVLLGTVNNPAPVRTVHLDDDLAFAAGPGTLYAIDVSAPTMNPVRSTLPFPAGARAVDVDGTHAYVAVGSVGLRIVDISDPEAPEITGEFDTGSTSPAITVDNDIVCISRSTEGVALIDVSDPDFPAMLGEFDAGGICEDLVRVGDTLHLADHSHYRLVDVSDPTNPQLIGEALTDGTANGVAVNGDRAFVTNEFGMIEFDISDPENPIEIGMLSQLSWALDVAVIDDDYVVIAEGLFGIRIVSVQMPSIPYTVGLMDTTGNTTRVHVEGDLVFMIDFVTGIEVIDVSDRHAPVHLGTVYTELARDAVVLNGMAYVADQIQGLVIIDFTDCSNFYCPSDLDGSGDTGFTDLLALLAQWGPCGEPCPTDLDNSGDTGFHDLLQLLDAWGPCP